VKFATATGNSVVVSGGAKDTNLTGCTLDGYTNNALFVSAASGTQVRSCTLNGRPSTGTGIMLDRADDTSLFFNMVSGHGGQGLVIQDSARVLVGPGNVVKLNAREGILVQKGGSGLATSATLQSTQVTNNGRNSAGVACRDSSAAIVNCTIAGPHQWGLFVASTASVSVANSILWGASYADRYTDRASTAMANTIYQRQGGAGSWVGSSNLTSDPLLANVAADDVHLLAGSPAKESGNNAPTAIALPSADLDGDARVMFAIVDRGADERVASGFVGNPLDLSGSWIRETDDGLLTMTLSVPQLAGRHAMMLASLSGATNGLPLGQGAVLPLQVDALTQAFLEAPSATLMALDAQGQASFVLAVPREFVAAVAREIAFAIVAVPELDFASNPVVVRFLR
jgi:hypothetical protein